MKYRLRILPEADDDISRIYLWIADKSGAGAATWYRRLSEVIESLSTQPFGWGPAPEGALVGRELRQVNFKTRRGRMYRLVFEIRGDEVLVLHIRGPGQSLLGRDEIRSG